MKHLNLFFVSLFFSVTISAQPNNHQRASRAALDPLKFPFYHGVASGDPLTDRVILWTRITLSPPLDPVTVGWQIATDTSFLNVVNAGNAVTDSSKDYTIKVDATGLQPNTWYYYRFSYDTVKSVIGRTKTLPVGNVNNLRFAVASCQGYQKGYYNAHLHIGRRNDIDAVLFLGDYTYENGVDSILDGRVHEPPYKTIQLSDYRMRQSLYHLDPDLQEAHRQYPWIAVWDDHETANNSYKDGARNHTAGDGPWYERKVNGIETYEAWMPVRLPDVNDTFKIFRRFTFGNLADLHMLDTRIYERDKQVASGITSVFDSLLLDSTRTMLGSEQFDWLKNNLSGSTAQWQILGQQVMMAPLVIPAGVFGPPSIVNPDQWDGYPYDRQKLYRHVLNNNIQNMVVLTGDIHTSWANDLPLDNYDTLNRNNSAGVEFVATSITSSNELPPLVSEVAVYGIAPHVRFVDLSSHGYYILDITPTRTQADFVFVSTVLSKTFSPIAGPSWYANSGERFLRQASTPSVALNSFPALAPGFDLNTSVRKIYNDIVAVMIHPNPFYNEVVVQFNLATPDDVTLQVFNAEGKQMLKENFSIAEAGLNHLSFDGSSLPTGNYVIKLSGKKSSTSNYLIKTGY
jgi:alkaline phosphatase D